MTHGISGIAALAIDCDDPVLVATFWQRLLGGEIAMDDDGDVELTGGVIRLDFLKVPHTSGDTAEAQTIKNKIHLDLRSYDYDGAITNALDAGATIADDVYDGTAWKVLRDPEGNEFCILRSRSFRP